MIRPKSKYSQYKRLEIIVMGEVRISIIIYEILYGNIYVASHESSEWRSLGQMNSEN